MAKQPPRRKTRDAVERSRVSARAESLHAEFDRLHAQVRRLQRLASMGATAATLAHEVNNLLTPVLGYAKSALKDDSPELMTKALQITVEQIDAVVAMTHRILDIAADRPAVVEAAPLREVVQNAILATCRDLRKDNISLVLDIDDAIAIRADARQLQQVFFNLLLNARDAIKGRSGRVTVRAVTAADAVHITFAGTGCGIPADRIDSVFDPFVTSKNEIGRDRAGSGLGLSVCREIIEDHSGHIRVESTPGKGTTFHITLPGTPDTQRA